jgi:hypothetical protein
LTLPLTTSPDGAPGAPWEIDCANCGLTVVTSPFDATAFCSVNCRAVARAVRYGRRQVARFGPVAAWSDDVLLGAVGRVPEGTLLAEIEQRWSSPRALKPCDHENWNDTWLSWTARHRRQATPVSK